MCNEESLREIPIEQIPETLVYLKISGTSIIEISERAFEERRIETLSLANNRIVTINRFIFQSL